MSRFDSLLHLLVSSSLLSSPLSSSITASLFHSRLKTYLFKQIFPTLRLLLPTGLPSRQRDRTGPIMLIVLFLVSHFNFLFVPCGGLSWLTVSFLLLVKYTLSYRIVPYRIQDLKSIGMTWEVAQQLAVNKEGWCRRVAQCVFDTGWTKV